MKKRTEGSAAQLCFKKVNGWGGKRKGAGRKNLSREPNHMARERINFQVPLHISLKLRPGMPNLRTEKFKSELVTAIRAAKEFGLRVLHFSIIKNHLHLIAESDNNRQLGSGMRSLCGRLSRSIRRIARELGLDVDDSVFRGRYYAKPIRTSAYMRNALEYVLLNQSKHEKLVEHLDRFSSGFTFAGLPKLLGVRFRGLIEEQFHPKPVALGTLGLSEPRSWLARQGWTRARGNLA